ncbi:hypothetical protein CRE_30250 [Caenorhabditis remanei]|uniref:Uncharacterized protein n=1 Tax=Caenorhabditis remanei TaxID=31234 RepID=E3NKN6_CAERE|nr:hypothetical protein CRE_30250 [Caenorhabditis remanei]
MFLSETMNVFIIWIIFSVFQTGNAGLHTISDRMGILGQVAKRSMKRKWLIEEVDWHNFGVFNDLSRTPNSRTISYKNWPIDLQEESTMQIVPVTIRREDDYNYSLKMKDRKMDIYCIPLPSVPLFLRISKVVQLLPDSKDAIPTISLQETIFFVQKTPYQLHEVFGSTLFPK